MKIRFLKLGKIVKIKVFFGLFNKILIFDTVSFIIIFNKFTNTVWNKRLNIK